MTALVASLSSWAMIRSMSGMLRSTSTRGSSAPRDRRPDRFGPQAQHELVVGLPVRPPLREVAHLDFLGAAVDADHVLPGPHIQREALAETFRRLQQQAVPVRDYPTDVVRQAAVRERDVMVTLEHDDLG